MNFKHKIAALLMATDVSAMAEVHYVDMNSTNATPPYTNWATAATNIQSAVDASMAGDEIVVTNGIYSGGLWVGKALILRSVNGWQLTTINGNQTARCAYLTNGASLTGFTLTNGFSQYHGGAVYGGTLNDCALRGNSAENGGGAAACLLNSCSLSSNSASISGGGAAYSTLNNCTLAGNSASSQGGGASYSTLKNCALTENSASYFGGGASSCPLTNCTLTGNSAQYAGGGASGSTLNNCIVYFNTANDGANYDSSSTLNYCCATPQPVSGIGNISLDPQMAGASHLSAASPCRGAGNAAYATGTDIDGESWANPPSIGCDDYHAGVVSGPLTVLIVASLTTVTPASAVQMKALIDGRTTASFWDFGDGITVSNRTYIAHTWTTLGDYPVVLRAYNDSQPGGISATVTVHVVDGVHYVAADSANPTAPYASWQTAATNIQDAMDAALEPGAVVLVTNGTYSSGRGVIFGTTNRVAAQRPVALRSVNGPQFTTIDGGHSIRCVYLTNGSSLCGFTLTNGFAQYYGGGVYCESGTVVISNCVLSGNSVANSGYGGGAFNATLNDCTVTNNSAGSGGGAYYCTLKNCKLAGNWASSGGGAAYGGSLTNCTLIGNWSLYAGGGTSSGTLNNCTLSGNWAYYGGGASASTLNNCTLSSNLVLYSTSYGGGNGGAAESCTLSNCTLNGNAAYLYGGGAYNCTLTNCILNGNVVYYDGGGGAASSTLNNCTLTGNSALGSYYGEGGGAYLGKLNGCSLTANSALYGGGAYEATLNNCTLTGNSARNQGGGAAYSTVNNCIAYYNSAPAGSNYADGRLDHCCTIPLPTDGFSSNNITSEPQLTDSSHLSPTSPCRGAGNAAYAFGVDIDGEPWANPPSIGCDEYHPGAVTGALSVTIVAGDTNVTAGFSLTFTATISGHAASNEWDFADGTLVANRPVASHTWSAPGDYVMVFRAYNQSNPAGVSATLAIHVVQAEHYVALSSGNPLPPYLSWATAAQSIQDAIDVSLPGAVIWVSNGVYQSGGHIATGGTSNRLTVTRPMTVRALNGPAETAILGSTNTTGPVRCAWLADGAVLDGFTLSGGATYDYGGGVWCASTNVLVANCILSGNKASSTGGGAYYGTLSNCALAGNLAENAYGGGAAYSVLLNCALTNNHAYYGGGGTYFGALNNCTLISNSISYPSGDGGGAYYATLNNCTLNGNTTTSGYGGGAYGGTLNGCSLSANSALYGGGTHGSTLNGCSLSGNAASYGGASSSSTLNNCTAIANSAQFDGGGTYNGTLTNCIIYYNSASTSNANYYGATPNFCCTTPLPVNSPGVTNIAAEPVLADASHLSAASPCRGAGTSNSVSGFDIDSEPWGSPPSIGCDEYNAAATTGALSVAIQASYTSVIPGIVITFAAQISGHASDSRWEFDDGTVVSNSAYTVHAWAGVGEHAVTLRAFNQTYPSGIAANLTIHVVPPPIHYVASASANPAAPYTNWSTAARTIQDAIDAAALPWAVVLVSNGTYAVGGRAVNGTLTNRVAVDKPLSLRSVNGPQFTIIQGRQVPGTTNGDGAIRCVYLANGASLSGFTLTNGATRSVLDYHEANGGGLWCESTSMVVVSNCVIIGSAAYYVGGGAYQGILKNCTLSGNSAYYAGGGGAYLSTLNDCTLNGNWAAYCGGAYYSTLSNCTLNANSGGGAASSTLNNCVLNGNSGNGASGCTLNNCTLSGNSAAAASSCTLNNCALTGNSAEGAYSSMLTNCTLSGNSGGGAYSSTLANCLIYFNPARNYDSSCTLNYCCTTPQPANGTGNISADPRLASAWRLSADSPCRGAGNAAYASGTDIDEEPWASPPSIGCDEYHAGALTGPLTVGIAAAFTNVAAGYAVAFTAVIQGRATVSVWDFGDGITVTNQPYISHSWTVPGDYGVVLRVVNDSQPGGVSATVTVHVANLVHYVAAASASPVAPYTSWATAATTIQDAVDAAEAGALVLVTNGIYATGGRAVFGTNRVAVNKPLTLRSVNGPQLTIIQGRQVPGTTNGDGAIRCMYLTNGASLCGFTLTSGATRAAFDYREGIGGAVWCESTSAVVVSNCVVSGNAAYSSGGAVYQGSLNNCTLTGNLGGGAISSTLNNCALSSNSAAYFGGASGCTLSNCTLTGNSASQYGGGGASGSTLNNCTLTGNSGSGAGYSTLSNCTLVGNTGTSGGGAWDSTLDHCTLNTNFASSGGGAGNSALNTCSLTGNSASGSGGGANGGTLNNCTLTGNSAGSGGGVGYCTLNDCTLTGNRATTSGGGAYAGTLSNCILRANVAVQYGGGAYGDRYYYNYSQCLLKNCTLTGNSAQLGGGAAGSTLNSCVLNGNSASSGGAVMNGILTNCTLLANSATIGGGAYGSTLNNCIAFFNTAPQAANYDSSSSPNYCCTTPLPYYGSGNISSEPQMASASHLSATSPCRGAGNDATGTDIDGESWASPPSIGCDEYHSGAVTGPLNVVIATSFTNVVAGFALQLSGLIEGRTATSIWDFGDGIRLTNQPYASHAWSALGDYAVVLRAYNESNPGGINATSLIHVVAPPIHYVSAANPNPVAPYASWSTAATNIQDAVDAAAMPGSVVLVSNGLYAAGGRPVSGTMTNRVAVGKPLTLRSVNGPQFTIIQGRQVPGLTNGDGAIRCVYLTNGASLSGFTLTNGATRTAYDYPASPESQMAGGGLWCESTNGVAVSNCVVAGNSAYYLGGGVYQGTLNTCALSGNSARYSYGGGSAFSVLLNCTLTNNQAQYGGGGTYYSTLNNCALIGNTAPYGGGAYQGNLSSCILNDNAADYDGGGAYYSTLNNCTLSANSASHGGGGASYSVLTNCITWFNAALTGANYDPSCSLNYCCAMPLPNYGVGNISVDPQLASASHLSAGSPCRGAGNPANASGTDIDGEAWSNPPSIGCDEYKAGAVTGPLTVAISAAITNVAVGYSVELTASIEGRTEDSVWEFGDGFIVLNKPSTSHAWATPGDYLVTLWCFNDSHPGGISASVTIHVVMPSIHYVALASTNPISPYNSWATAATNIQDAVNAATLPGALVLVTNGIYSAGGRATAGDSTTNRVAIDKPLDVRSVNGPRATVIDGGYARRCVFLNQNASLSGFSLTNGTGGAYGGTLNGCTLKGNFGTVAYLSTLNNCELTGNPGLAASACTLNNCTLSGNSGGGAAYSILNNCISYFNMGQNYDSDTTLNYSCTTPQPNNGVGNISANPQLASASHLSAASPCRGTGNPAYASGTDIDGEAWNNPPSIGCDEYNAGAVTGPLSVDIAASPTNMSAGFAVQLTALIQGRTTASAWDFGDGSTATNQPYISHAWAAPGDYAVLLRAFNESQPGGISATVLVHVVAGLHYVAADCGNPVAPYTSWATAARSIQGAIGAALEPGAQVLVTNGQYGPIQVPALLAVRSVNGPQSTSIYGSGRCAYLASGANLSGFTLTHGSAEEGGGVFCQSRTAVVSNCVLSGNAATPRHSYNYSDTDAYGGGAYGGTLNNCTLTGNSVTGYDNGYDYGIGYGGGAYDCTLNNCTLSGNSAIGHYRSSYYRHCEPCGFDNLCCWDIYTYDIVYAYGGGAYQCTLNNCTLKGNSAYSGGGGTYDCDLNNSIILDDAYESSLNYCWTTAPLFVDEAAGNLRLQSNSPCINAGNNDYAFGSTDLDGRTRILGGTVDIGAYEFQPGQGGDFIRWLAQYGLRTDGSADFTDKDGDQMNNWQEWVAGTDPTDPASVLRLLAPVPAPAGLLLRWNGDTNHSYFVQRATSLDLPLTFSLLRTNVPGRAGMTTFIDTAPPGVRAAFYRVGTASANGSSPLSLQTPVFMPASVVVSWTSVANRSYFLERATNLGAPATFTLLATNIPGQAGTTSFTDTNVSGSGPFFYRVGVRN